MIPVEDPSTSIRSARAEHGYIHAGPSGTGHVEASEPIDPEPKPEGSRGRPAVKRAAA
jgi:hypothetical protein